MFNKSTHTSRVLIFKCTFALVIVALLVTLSLLILASAIRDNESSARIVNISGRQRMLSQRIALFSLELMSSNQPEKKYIRKS